MTLHIAFQMDGLARLNAQTDSTLALIEEGSRRGHKLYHFEPHALSWQEGRLTAQGAALTVNSTNPLTVSLEKPETLNLESFDVLFIRQEPPFDLGYLSTTYLLDHLIGKVLMVNDPRGLRESPEKLLITHFADLMPPTLISRSVQDIQHFHQQYRDIVIKPLYSFGGEGVMRFTANDLNLEAALDLFKRSYPGEPWMIQQFLPEILQGDRRLFLLEGELIGGYTRVPAPQSIRSNSARGGQPQAHEITEAEREICRRLGPTLRARGLFFVGIDLIGPYLTEINGTCPTGLRVLNHLYHQNAAEIIWQALEKKL